jgi:hypothetical protein
LTAADVANSGLVVSTSYVDCTLYVSSSSFAASSTTADDDEVSTDENNQQVVSFITEILKN